jgi:acyl-CoA synthetase (AMP-forming)/AMP-acid ligase II
VAYRNLGDGSSITFGVWDRQSNRLAHGLRDRGLAQGDLVALFLEAEHILGFIVAYSAVHRLGAVAVPLNNRLSPPEARGILEHAGVNAVVTSGSLAPAVVPLLGGLSSLDLVATVTGARAGSGAEAPGAAGAVRLDEVMSSDDSPIQVALTADDLADVMYTSGTTGRPKGVAVRHGNIALLPNTRPAWPGWGSSTTR